MITKEMMIHIAVTTAVTGVIFAIIFSSGATSLDQLKIDVFARAEYTNDLLFLTYTIHNVGDYNIQNVTVTANCCSFVKLLNSTSSPNILESKDYIDVIPISGLVPGNDIVLQFEARDAFGNNAVDIMTVILE